MKMNNLIQELKDRIKGRVVLVCIGNRLKGDDGAAIVLGEALEGKIQAEIIVCGEVPENFTGKIKEKNPDTIVLIDAADMKSEPGSVSIIPFEKLLEMKIYTTHNIPLKVLADYLHAETEAEIFLIGIQPEYKTSGQKLSRKVRITVDRLIEILTRELQ
jgi:hydrogenase 3 maturation protease